MTSRSIQVANYIVALCDEAGIEITHLKLQKLLYYVEGRSLAILEKSIVDDTFEAWVNGPVCRAVYNFYQSAWFAPIVIWEWYDIGSYTGDEDSLINEVVNKYGDIDAWDLVALTHNEAPRIEARKWIDDSVACNFEIPQNLMKEYFSAKLHND